MKHLIAAIWLGLCVAATAQTTNEFATFYDGTNLYSKGGSGTYGAITSLSTSNLTLNGKLQISKAELSLAAVAQDFTAAAGYEVVTNFTQYSRGTALSTTSTSIVNNAEQDLVLLLTASLESSAVNNDVECHVFTNGVDTVRIDVDKDSTLTFDHLSLIAIQQ
jgi:hypothetical protein